MGRKSLPTSPSKKGSTQTLELKLEPTDQGEESECLTDYPGVPVNAHSQRSPAERSKKRKSAPDLVTEPVDSGMEVFSVSSQSTESKRKKGSKDKIPHPSQRRKSQTAGAVVEPTEEIAQISAEEESEDEDESATVMRFQIPEDFVDYKFKGRNQPWLEDTDDKQFWLIKAPLNYDVSKLEGKSITLGGTMVLEKENIQGIPYLWEMHAAKDSSLKKSNWCAFLPSNVDKKLHPAGPLCGQISLIKTIQPQPVVIPTAERKQVVLPEGLKIRNIPFGCGKSCSKPRDKKAEASTRHKSHKDKRKSHH